MNSRVAIRSVKVFRALSRNYSEGTTSSQSSSSTASSTSQNLADVPGLSSSCVVPEQGPVGPGVDPKKSGAYKVPEYYCYNAMSFFEAEIEMKKYRLPQPSAMSQK